MYGVQCPHAHKSQRTDSTQIVAEVAYSLHLFQNDRAQTEEAADKQKAQNDSSFLAVTFYLQGVLHLPKGDESQLYYKRKLVLYNLKLHEGASPNNAHCLFWPETEGKRGSSALGGIAYAHLSGLPSTMRHVSLISVSCSGQNRNQFIAAVMQHAIHTLPIDIIDHKFLIPGHTQMECDSMQSAIESHSKFLSLYIPRDWENVMKLARRIKTYRSSKIDV